MPERLQKILSAAGLGSRRACEQLILEGNVRVNGQLVNTLPVLVEENDRIEVGGRPIRQERKVYFMLHKPRGVVVSNSDPAGRTLAVDLLPGVSERVFPVGRLEQESSGLLLLTNDGELSNRLTHPRYEVAKTYEVQVDGNVDGEKVQRLLAGVYLAEGRTRLDRIRVLSRSYRESRLAITLIESRNRQIRRMLAKLGHKVRRMQRTSIGKLTLRGVGVGHYRPLEANEIRYLKQMAGLLPGRESPAVQTHAEFPSPRSTANTAGHGRGRSEGPSRRPSPGEAGRRGARPQRGRGGPSPRPRRRHI
ncbi:MAG: pseudouridine synthase [Phycisphaerae bacterium]|nr:pseudouridine synthase [Phycisphaerae bacterium]